MNMHFSIPKKIKINSIFLGIICGGQGTRLKKINKNKPKIFTKITKNKNFFESFLKKKITKLNENIVFLTSDLDQKYKNRILNANKNFYIISEKKKLGTAGSLIKNIKYFKKDFILIFGDIFFEDDLRKIYNYHKKNKNDLTIHVHKKNNIFDVNLIELNNDYTFSKIIINKKGKHKQLMNLCLGGIYIFNKNIFNRAANFKHKNKLDLESDFLKNVLKKKKIKAGYYFSSKYLKDFGTPARLNLLKNYLCKKNKIKIKKRYYLNSDKNMLEGLAKINTKLQSVNKVRFNYVFTLTIYVKRLTLKKKFLIHKKIDSFFANNNVYLDFVKFSNSFHDKRKKLFTRVN